MFQTATFEEGILAMTIGSERSDVFKCDMCETDYQLQSIRLTAIRAKLVLECWKQFGRQHADTISTKQLFQFKALQLDADAVSQRDVRAIFESTMGQV